MYVCECMYVYVCICVYVDIHVCMYVCMCHTQYCVPLAVGTKSSIDAVISAEAVPSLSRGMVTIGLV